MLGDFSNTPVIVSGRVGHLFIPPNHLIVFNAVGVPYTR